ncbi:MAG: EamA family transporter [Desulfurococcales archaeon]|nr:EamA family transporter [Desulfurococcales archaeon]
MPRPEVQAATAGFLWGTLGAAFKLASTLGASIDWLIAGRAIVASTGSLVLMILGRMPSGWSVIVGLLGLAPMYTLYPLSVDIVGVGLASILLYTAPLWVAILGFLHGEPPDALGSMGVILGFSGTVLLVGSDGHGDTLGILLGLASGVSYALYIVLARVAQVKGASSDEVGVHAIPFAAIAMTLLLRPQPPSTPVDLAAALYLGLVATLLPYMLHTRALARLEAYRVSVISLVEPVTAVALGILLFGEEMSPIQAVGAVLVLGSVALVTGIRSR